MTSSALNAIVAVGVALIGVGGTVGGIYLGAKLNQVHTLVNASHTALSHRIEQLEAVIAASNMEIPPTTRETGKA